MKTSEFRSVSGEVLVEVVSLVAERTFVRANDYSGSCRMLTMYTECGTKTRNRIHRAYILPRKVSAAERLFHILDAIDECKTCPPTREAWRVYVLGYVTISEVGCDVLTRAGIEKLAQWRRAQSRLRAA